MGDFTAPVRKKKKKALFWYQGTLLGYLGEYFLLKPTDHPSPFLTSVKAGLLDDDLMPSNCSP